VCSRYKDELVDTKASKFPKCSITLGCSGILKPVQYTDSGDTIANSAPEGVQNWYSRFKTVTNFTIGHEQLVPISYGSPSELIFAASLSIVPTATDKLKITFIADSADVRPFREYTFNFTSAVDKILGVESSQAKKVLRFTAAEEVKVFKNGVLMTSGVGLTDYQIANSSNTTPQNCIVLNQTYKGNNQFKVVVSSPPVQSRFDIVLDKTLDITQLQSGWENVNSFNYQNKVFHLFAKNLDGALIPVGKNISIETVTLIRSTSEMNVNLSDIFCLLSKGPTSIDRALTTAIPGSKLSGIGRPIAMTLVDAVNIMVVNETIIDSLYPPFVCNTFSIEPLLSKSVVNPVTDMVDNTYIVGPNI
jgi:hypothetical protein